MRKHVSMVLIITADAFVRMYAHDCLRTMGTRLMLRKLCSPLHMPILRHVVPAT